MKKIFITIPLVSVLVAIISISLYYQIESTRPVCIEGSFPNGTCKGPILVESEPDVKRVTVSGKDAQDVCVAMKIPCPSKPTFSAADYGQFISTVFTVNQDIYEVRLNKTSVCVIPQTANPIPTCYPREDEKKYFVEILDLQQNYTVNNAIPFIVHEKGFDVRCFSAYAKILDSSGNKIWEQSQIMECAPGLGKSNFDNRIPFEARIEKTGSYDLFVESRGWELKRQFSVSDAPSDELIVRGLPHALPILHTAEDLEKLSKYTLNGKVTDIKPIIQDEKTTQSDKPWRFRDEISIKVQDELKDQHANDTIKFRSTIYVTLNPFSKSVNDSQTFQVGENVTVFLTGKEPESDFANSYVGFIANKYVFSEGIAHDVTSTKQVSPLQQHKSGTLSRSVNCNDMLELLIKASSGQPICVKPSTKAKLVERGWATP